MQGILELLLDQHWIVNNCIASVNLSRVACLVELFNLSYSKLILLISNCASSDLEFLILAKIELALIVKYEYNLYSLELGPIR